MPDNEECQQHPWLRFLKARYCAILWMKDEMGYDDETIAKTLCMDTRQVFAIRTYKDNREVVNAGQ